MWHKQKDRFRKNPGDGVDVASESMNERIADDG